MNTELREIILWQIVSIMAGVQGFLLISLVEAGLVSDTLWTKATAYVMLVIICVAVLMGIVTYRDFLTTDVGSDLV